MNLYRQLLTVQGPAVMAIANKINLPEISENVLKAVEQSGDLNLLQELASTTAQHIREQEKQIKQQTDIQNMDVFDDNNEEFVVSDFCNDHDNTNDALNRDKSVGAGWSCNLCTFSNSELNETGYCALCKAPRSNSIKTNNYTITSPTNLNNDVQM